MLLAVAFIPPGLVKLSGCPFTTLPPSHPVGYFFDAFFQAEAYYRFVGGAQVVASLLLLHPRTALVGALAYFPIILNIAVITSAIGFEGTRFITALMTLACLYLLFWDGRTLLALVSGRKALELTHLNVEYRVITCACAVIGAVVYAGVALTGLAHVWLRLGLLGLAFAIVLGACFGSIVAWHLRQIPAS